jgi:hypothetical protein
LGLEKVKKNHKKSLGTIFIRFPKSFDFLVTFWPKKSDFLT